MSFRRSDRSRLAEWWRTVDHRLLALVLALIAVGVLLSLAASPAVALRRGFEPYHFFSRHLVFAALAVGIVIAVSFLSPRGAWRLAVGLLAAGLLGMVAVLMVGPEINGARRWLPLFGQTIQPSEIVKPGVVVVLAWLFAEARRRPDMPGLALAFTLTGVVAALLLAQPDVGQTVLIVAATGALYVLSGQPLIGAVALAGVVVAGVASAYATLPHVRLRIDGYLSGVPEERSQLARALEAFAEGGLLGRGPGEGTVKSQLADAHTDFIFAVLAEEYGAVACLVVVALYAAVSLSAVAKAADRPDDAERLAVIGLALLIAGQATINIGVNVGLLPAKGMTLPFVSAGGSSLLAAAVTAGLMLAWTRRRAEIGNLKKPRLVATS
jgi:cell division protein FtsW